MQCVQYCMLHAGYCKTDNAIVFLMSKNLRVRIFSEFGCQARSSMQ